jgi:predicted DNA-binding transcriptional regulator YafY
MPSRPTKPQRWLDLVALLLGRRVPLSVEEIMERVPAYAPACAREDATSRASARRMFERDKDELRAAGIPIETVRYSVNYGAEDLEGYRIERAEFYLPYLRLLADASDPGPPAPGKPYGSLSTLDLTPAEAGLAIDALRHASALPAFPFAEEARSALRKLTFDLDAEGFPEDPVLWVERPGASELLASLRVLSDALLARKRVAFDYHGIHRGETTRRDVAPYGLFFQRDWYLVGHDATRDAVRVFRVARMEGVEANAKAPKKPDYELPPDFRLPGYLKRSAWQLGEEGDAVTAEVHFRYPLSLRAARAGRGELVEEDDAGGAVRRFTVTQPNPFLRWILSLGGEAEILSPPEQRAEYAQMVEEVAALYATEAAHG